MIRLPLARTALLSPVLAAAIALSACGSDDDGRVSSSDSPAETTATPTGSTADSTSPTTPGVPVHDAKPTRIKTLQADLEKIGCYGGTVDGKLGPQTQAAVRSFQTGAKLTVDGLIGPATEAAADKAAAAGTKVCTDPAPATTTKTSEKASGGGSSSSSGGQTASGKGSSTASLSAASYAKSFPLSNCSLNADVSNLSLRGSADGMSFSADASQGGGTVGVSGGTESDGITLNGTISRVTIGTDRSFTASGKFSGPNFSGESFTLHGVCPE